MKKCFAVCLVFSAILLSMGCGGGEDNSVKEAPPEVQTKTAEEAGRGRTKRGEDASRPTMGGESGVRSGG